MDEHVDRIIRMAETFFTVTRIQQDEIVRLKSEIEFLKEELRTEQMRNTLWEELTNP